MPEESMIGNNGPVSEAVTGRSYIIKVNVQYVIT